MIWRDVGAAIRLLVYPMIVFFKMIGCKEFANIILRWTQTMDIRSCIKTWLLNTLELEQLSGSLSDHQSRESRSESRTKSKHRRGFSSVSLLATGKRKAPLPPPPIPMGQSLDHTKHRHIQQSSAPQAYVRPGTVQHLRPPPPYGTQNAPHPRPGQGQSQRYNGTRPGAPLPGQPQYLYYTK